MFVKTLFFWVLGLLVNTMLLAGALEETYIPPNARVALFPGTYDPPHAGHLAIAQEALESGAVDYVVIIVNDFNIHKLQATSAIVREQMLRSLVMRDPRILLAPTGRFSFPRFISIANFIRRKQPTAEFTGILGQDIAVSLLKSAPFVLAAKFIGIKNWIVNTRGSEYNQRTFFDGNPIQLISPEGAESASSTKIRNRMRSSSDPVSAEEAEALGLLPEVFSFIFENRLYGSNASSCVGILLENTLEMESGD